jgi:ABC-type nitrate/sulfonate/bicarbonate transport system substrate-binding protein
MRDSKITSISVFARRAANGKSVRSAVLTLLLAVFLSVTTDAHAANKLVNFASNTPTLSGTLPLIVAQEFGFFAAEGLEVRTV